MRRGYDVLWADPDGPSRRAVAQQVARDCEWHDKQFRSAGGRVLKGSLDDPPITTSDLGIKDKVALELKMASNAVQKQRKEKLRLLLEEENLAYEAELDARGLAIAKTRL